MLAMEIVVQLGLCIPSADNFYFLFVVLKRMKLIKTKKGIRTGRGKL